MRRGRHEGPGPSPRLAAAVAASAVLSLLLAASLALMATSSSAEQRSAAPGAGTASASSSAPAAHPVPVYAYFYQWFQASSWRRAKQDYPLVGRYSSDDMSVLRLQVQQARGAGIDGFLTSWKSTPALNRRLDNLVSVARADGFDLGVVYEALDFDRNPLPITTVRRDMVYLVDRWGSALTSRYYGRPVIIWTGTDQYSVADVQSVRAALGDRAYLLAASRSVAGYERIASLVDGEAYYWSSADPSSTATRTKLEQLGQAVHAHGGLWFAPASGGFDGRTLGGTRVIGRQGGATLVASLDNAYAAQPDAVAVISWNEWSENTYIEPGEMYGDQELSTLRSYLAARGTAIPAAFTEPDSSTSAVTGSGWTGRTASAVLVMLGLGTVVVLAWSSRRRAHAHSGPGRGTGRGGRPMPSEPATTTE